MSGPDYESLAAKYGGQPVDYDAVAAKYGGQDATTPQEPSRLRQLAGGVEALGSLATGAVAAPLAGLAGISQGITNAVVPDQIPAGDRVRQVQEALTYQPRTAEGQKVVQTVGAPFEWLAEHGDQAGGYVTDKTGDPLLGAEVNTVIQSAPALLGKAAQPLVGRAKVLADARTEVMRRLAEKRDAAVQAARDAGYVLPPAEANPGLLNRLLEGVSGQAKVQQLASAKNQPITNQIVRKSLGIRDDVPISVESLEAVRKNAGQPFEEVRKTGRVTADDTYRQDLDAIGKTYEGAEKDFPAMAQTAVRDSVDAARVQSFSADSGVDAIKLQRKLADKAFRQGDSELGKAHKAVADAIEGQIERHLETTQQNPQLLAELRHSREIIARSYDVQKALKGNDVDARVLSAQLRKKNQRGGDLAVVGEMGERFPGAVQTGSRNAYTNANFGDVMIGGSAAIPTLLHGAGGQAAAAAGLLAAGARPGIRAAILSTPYQRLGIEPSYAPKFRTLSQITSDEAAAAALAAQGFVHGEQQ